jgi:tRNA-splicing ligase RtcB
MPDCHQGYGMPIGGVLATQRVVIPNAVGVDIGCGMCAIKTPWHISEIDKDNLKKIMAIIREEVPVGMRHHKVPQDKNLMPGRTFISDTDMIVSKEYQSALVQLGTLGGGNHFIEIQKDSLGMIWIMLHSGSRNLGFKTAKFYNELAKNLNGKWFAHVPKEWELAFLPLDSDEGMDYIHEMEYCTEFALANRKLMMERITEAFYKVMQYKRVDLTQMINIAHNYARMENHFGQNVMVHRKGATSARAGEVGIIPGSQGTKSYIVIGLGNKESFESCSHGSGRLMSRTKAQETLNLEEEIKNMEEKGIIHGMRTKSNLDECASAYKNIDEVMDNQKDLVEIVTELTPVAVIKGD